MAATNILTFSPNDIGTNLLTDAAYLAASDRSNGNQPGIASAKLNNKALRQVSVIAAGVAQYLANIQNTDISDTLTAAQIAAMFAGANTGSMRVAGLVGAPTSTTVMQLQASSITLRNAAGGLWTINGAAAISNNISTAGPVANGRDQAAAFSTGAWVHYHFIWNGTTLATIASLSATAPTLPSGYTHWAYAASMPMGAAILTPTRYRGDKAFYDTAPQVLSGAGNTTETVTSVSTTVPPNAPSMLLMVNMGLSTNASGAAGSNLAIRHTSGATFATITSSVAVANQTAWNSCELETPNLAQQFYFLFFNETNAANLAGRQAFVNVLGFTLPNGG